MNEGLTSEYAFALERFFGDSMAHIYSTTQEKREGLLMGCPVWGDLYIARFRAMCLPTLLSAKNLDALRGRCRMVLFTDKPNFTSLWDITRQLERSDAGIDLQIHVIPDELMRGLGVVDNAKYWILGVISNILVQMAGRLGMGYHSLHPDHLYGEAYFQNLERLSQTHEAICQTGISADVDGVWKCLEAHRLPDGTIPIPDRDLGTIGWANLHKQTQACLMVPGSIPTSLPDSHFMLWQGKDKLHLYCCHMNAAYMSPRLCNMAKPRIPATLDAELPSFMPPDNFYVPTAEDGVTFIEVSDDSKWSQPKRVNLEKFAERCFSQTRWQDDWLPWFRKVCEVPIDEQETYVEDAQIKQQHAWILAQLRDDKPTLKARLAYQFIGNLAFKP